MAAIPSSSSLVATHNYYWCRLCSTSSNSSCGSAKYPGEAIPHHPGLPKATPGHWWPSFLFRKSTLPFMATVLERSTGDSRPKGCDSAHQQKKGIFFFQEQGTFKKEVIQRK
uniref:Uncharacterized protein n=1 Tax=Urocitellus parryii TaxID=9999 RepID=A0A8D2IGT7_UROPR